MPITNSLRSRFVRLLDPHAFETGPLKALADLEARRAADPAWQQRLKDSRAKAWRERCIWMAIAIVLQLLGAGILFWLIGIPSNPVAMILTSIIGLAMSGAIVARIVPLD